IGPTRRFLVLFFFQAEDGIRDFHVTGVQTCALPIYIDEGVEPGPGTSYTVPEGNLFTGEEYDDVRDKVREEIFVMGARNPFRIEVDPGTNSLSWGDYGPDASASVAAANPNRGPMGYVEWNVVS